MVLGRSQRFGGKRLPPSLKILAFLVQRTAPCCEVTNRLFKVTQVQHCRQRFVAVSPYPFDQPTQLVIRKERPKLPNRFSPSTSKKCLRGRARPGHADGRGIVGLDSGLGAVFKDDSSGNTSHHKLRSDGRVDPESGQASRHVTLRPLQRSLLPVRSTSIDSAIDDFPDPLRPDTTVSPGAGSNSTWISWPIPRNPFTRNDERNTAASSRIFPLLTDAPMLSACQQRERLLPRLGPGQSTSLR